MIDLERPWLRLELMKALATGEKTQVALAEEYGCDQSSISKFGTRHAEEIQALRSKLDDEWAGLWVARKAARLAVYQQDIEEIQAAGVTDDKLLTIKHKALRLIAEELGQLSVNMNMSGKILHHIIEGVELSDLE